ncbi:hypothetical protein QTP99_00600 [Caldanaerobacter subterraneus KAk]|uniref:hypothetical protein n=1 Tax=Caldanaerobacter subterraneus TaxID=911092 RepID=UPI0032C19B65
MLIFVLLASYEIIKQVCFYMYEIYEKDKLSKWVVDFVEKRKVFYSRWRNVLNDDDIIYKMIGTSKFGFLIWFMMAVYGYIYAKGINSAIGFYIIFGILLSLEGIEQICFYKYKNYKVGKYENLSKCTIKYVETEIKTYNIAYKIPRDTLDQNRIDSIIKHKWINIAGYSLLLILEYSGFFKYISSLFWKCIIKI